MPNDTNSSFLKAPTIIGIVSNLLGHPVKHILLRWNWKSAVLSATMRSSIYLATYLINREGLKSALSAMAVEFLLRSFTAGISGSLIQSFRCAKPVWLATLVVIIILPIISHTIEFFTHYMHEAMVSYVYSSPMIEKSRISSFYFSIAFSILSVTFNMFAARRGVFIIGKDEGAQSLWKDIKQMPGIIAEFSAIPFLWVRRKIRANTNQ